MHPKIFSLSIGIKTNFIVGEFSKTGIFGLVVIEKVIKLCRFLTGTRLGSRPSPEMPCKMTPMAARCTSYVPLFLLFTFSLQEHVQGPVRVPRGHVQASYDTPDGTLYQCPAGCRQPLRHESATSVRRPASSVLLHKAGETHTNAAIEGISDLSYRTRFVKFSLNISYNRKFSGKVM